MRPPYELNQRIPRTPIDMKHFIKFMQLVAFYTSYSSHTDFFTDFLSSLSTLWERCRHHFGPSPWKFMQI